MTFHRPSTCVLQQSATGNPDSCQWFPGALLNIAECALQVNDPDAPAIVYAHSASPDRCDLRLHNFITMTFRNWAHCAHEHAKHSVCMMVLLCHSNDCECF